jgi:hypothetical protein
MPVAMSTSLVYLPTTVVDLNAARSTVTDPGWLIDEYSQAA